MSVKTDIPPIPSNTSPSITAGKTNKHSKHELPDREQIYNKIDQKLGAGEKLTPEEFSALQHHLTSLKNKPEELERYLRNHGVHIDGSLVVHENGESTHAFLNVSPREGKDKESNQVAMALQAVMPENVRFIGQSPIPMPWLPSKTEPTVAWIGNSKEKEAENHPSPSQKIDKEKILNLKRNLNIAIDNATLETEIDLDQLTVSEYTYEQLLKKMLVAKVFMGGELAGEKLIEPLEELRKAKERKEDFLNEEPKIEN